MGMDRKNVQKEPWNDIPDWAHTLAKTLLQALKERDPYTYGHSRRVSRNAKLLADAAGLALYEQRVVEFASLFHDLGKMGVPDSILMKPGRLTVQEEAIMRAHPQKSTEILSPLMHIKFFNDIMPGILSHHERIDGRGYPEGLSGETIPVAARVILICDTFDAMTTTRPYRKGLTLDEAYKELRVHAGSQFDFKLVQAFVQHHTSWGTLEEEITEEFISTRFKKAA